MEGFGREWISQRGVNGAGSMKQILPNTKILNQANRFLEEKKSYMSYLNQVWMVASMAVVQGHTNQGHKWKTGIKSLQHGKQKLFSDTDSDASDL